MGGITDDERREAASRLRELAMTYKDVFGAHILDAIGLEFTDSRGAYCSNDSVRRLADLVEPSVKPDGDYEAWCNGLSHGRDAQTVRGIIEEIVWTTLTIDLGPNGNTDPSTGIDEGSVQTDRLFTWWERELLRLSGGIDRDALLKLADAMDKEADAADAARRALLPGDGPMEGRGGRGRCLAEMADRVVSDACTLRAAALIVRELCGEEGR